MFGEFHPSLLHHINLRLFLWFEEPTGDVSLLFREKKESERQYLTEKLPETLGYQQIWCLLTLGSQESFYSSMSSDTA
jgi:hypothetical protein